MVSKSLLSLLLVLAVFSPALMAVTSAKLPGFTSYVVTPPPPIAQTIAYFQKALTQDVNKITADKKVSNEAYLAGFQSLTASDRSKVDHEYTQLKSRVERLRLQIRAGISAQAKQRLANAGKQAIPAGAKKLAVNSQTKSKAQVAALKAPTKINIYAPHNAEEAKIVDAEVQRLVNQQNAQVAAIRAAAVAGLKIVGDSVSKIAKDQAIKVAFVNMGRPDQLKEIARLRFESLSARATLERAILGWTLVKTDTKAKLIKQYPVAK